MGIMSTNENTLLEHARLLVPSPVVASFPPPLSTPPTSQPRGRGEQEFFGSSGSSAASGLTPQAAAPQLANTPMHPYMMYMHMMQMQPFAMPPPFAFMAPFYPYSVGMPMMAPPSKRHRNLGHQGSSSA